ncbi:DUF2637 domain-containing protein [Kitasatospora arboriphila]
MPQPAPPPRTPRKRRRVRAAEARREEALGELFRTLLAVAVTVVCVLGWVLSYPPLQDLALARVPGGLSALWPVVVYGPWLAGCLSVLRAALDGRARCTPGASSSPSRRSPPGSASAGSRRPCRTSSSPGFPRGGGDLPRPARAPADHPTPLPAAAVPARRADAAGRVTRRGAGGRGHRRPVGRRPPPDGTPDGGAADGW